MITSLVKQINLTLKAPFQFSPKVQFEISDDLLLIKTVNNFSELNKVLKLPIVQFGSEMVTKNEKMNFQNIIDWDMVDLTSDHIMLIDKKRNLILAGARINASLFVEDLESEKEFHLENFLQIDDILLEVNQFRMSNYCKENVEMTSILNALYKGISKYGEYVNVDRSVISFSCSGISAREGALLFQHFKQNGHVNNTIVKPRVGKEFPQMRGWLRVFDRPLSLGEAEEANLRTPSEMKILLEKGSKILSQPSWDAIRGCFKFLVSV